MFIVTKEWLKENYGSLPEQVGQAKDWLARHAVDFNMRKAGVYAEYKHLTEYQPNTHDIVDQALAMVGKEFESELQVHRLLNIMRFGAGARGYENATLLVKPHSILELGVGGDAGISTAIFLAYLEKAGGYLISVDRDKMHSVWTRFGGVPFWTFMQKESTLALDEYLDIGGKFDMIFLDTQPTYYQSKRELERAYLMTNNILIDDANTAGDPANWGPNPGKVGSIKEFLEEHPEWERTDFGEPPGHVALLTKTMEVEE